MKLSGLRLITTLAGLPAIVALPIIGCGTKKTAATTVTDKAIDKIVIKNDDVLAIANAAEWKGDAILELIQKKVSTEIAAVKMADIKTVETTLVGTIPAAPGAGKYVEVKFTVKPKDAADGTFSKEFIIKVNQIEA